MTSTDSTDSSVTDRECPPRDVTCSVTYRYSTTEYKLTLVIRLTVNYQPLNPSLYK